MIEPVPTRRVDWWSLSDAQLAQQCHEDRFRARGPGGQKRNKTDSAIRLRHAPSGLMVIASESRSQHANRRQAVRRLRDALAFAHRQPIIEDALPGPLAELCRSGRLDLRARDERFLPVAAYVLDLLAVEEGKVADVARRLGISTANLVHFFRTRRECWQAVQEIRGRYQRKPLR